MQCSLFDKRQKTSTNVDIVSPVSVNDFACAEPFGDRYGLVLSEERATNLSFVSVTINRKRLLAKTAKSVSWPRATQCALLRSVLAGAAPCHLRIRRAVLVHVADAGLGFHVDVRIRVLKALPVHRPAAVSQIHGPPAPAPRSFDARSGTLGGCLLRKAVQPVWHCTDENLLFGAQS